MTEIEDTIRTYYNKWRQEGKLDFDEYDKEAFEAGWKAATDYIFDVMMGKYDV